MNAKLDKVCEALAGKQDKVPAKGTGEASSSYTHQDDAIAILMRRQEEMRIKLELAVGAQKKVESLEAQVCSLEKLRDEITAEAETWKKEALRSGNKRSRIALSPSAQSREACLTTPVKSTCRPQVDMSHLKELHNLEVNALKGLRLQELNRRRETEHELAEMKKKIAQLELTKKTPRSSLRDKLEEVVEITETKDDRVKSKISETEADIEENNWETFIKGEKKALRNLKKEEVMKICKKEGIVYSTLPKTVNEIIAKRVVADFGEKKKKKSKVDETYEDICAETVDGGTNEERDSAAS
ncbi:hypothetical protein CBR_g31226 [Chara braunii]|uniref:Uncharacterized protein n=1 Tax=Chara braunii TaxID=69332 RepID=A0A388JXR0_CHABU|nr:hypothetical protein CBR_g31226 [Chara braunii]|eukprot:GBG62590.1 hypothetical protein CBR_g31226 [Chara braunii]